MNATGNREVATARAPCDQGRVLIVDDDRTVRDVFRRVLAFFLPDLQADMAEDGAKAVQAFEQQHQGVILLDLWMPVMDGVAAFHRICQVCRDQNWELPQVVLCSGFAPPRILPELLALNPGSCFLQKPFANETLLAVLRSRRAA